MNWKQIIAEIQTHSSLTQADIGKACGTTQSTISSLINKEGAQPAYTLGVKLMAIHKKHIKRTRTAQGA